MHLADLLPNQPCVLCGHMTHQGVWCADCDTELPYFDLPHCPICALPTPLGEVCGQCVQHPKHITQTQALFAYQFPLDKLIQAMKFGEQLLLAPELARRLATIINTRPDGLIAMPLHVNRLRQRGFNQSLLLAETIGHTLKIPVWRDVCQRVRDTAAQSGLPWQERLSNMRDAFACHGEITGKHIAIIDDVMTTGATVNALAQLLCQQGAKQVDVWVVARTLPRDGRGQMG